MPDRRHSSVLSVLAWVGLALAAAGPVPAQAPPEAAEGRGRGWLGVFLDDAVDGGVELVAVVAGSPAARAGLRRGDVVLEIDGRTVADVEALTRALEPFGPGRWIDLGLLRSGRDERRGVRLGSRPGRPAEAPRAALAAPRPPQPPEPVGGANVVGLYGFQLSEVTPDLRAHFGAPAETGVLVTGLDPERPAAAAGFRVGDVLVRLGTSPVQRVGDVEQVLVTRGDGDAPIEAVLVRGGEPTRIQLLALSARAPAPAPVPQAPAAPIALDDRRRLEAAVQAEIARLRQRIRQLEDELEALREPR